MRDAAVARSEAFRETEGEIRGDFAGEEHPEERCGEGGVEPDDFLNGELVVVAMGAEFPGFDEEGIDVHVLRRILDAPFNPFDDDEVGEGIPVEGVEEEDPFFLEDAGGFGNEKVGFFHVLQHVHGARRVERFVGKGEGVGVGLLVMDGVARVVLLGCLKALFREVDSGDRMARFRKGVRQEAGSAPDVEDGNRGGKFSRKFLDDPRIADSVFGSEKRDRVVRGGVPIFFEMVVEGVVY